MKLIPMAALVLLVTSARAQTVRSWEGTVMIPTYEPAARETEPPLFANSSLTGFYPFTTYTHEFQPGGPKPKAYSAIFVENEYLKLTYIPDFGGRLYSLYDKIRGREVFYRNDVVKPASYNPRNSWPISGMELTGPYDVHMLTLHGEPYWSNRIVRREDGAVSLVLAEFDPVYQMRVNLVATLHPGVGALEVGVFCFNPRDARMPQMFWLSTAVSATPKLRYIYPMSRTIGHVSGGISNWPVHSGVDYSWDRNNVNMLGVFGIDFFDDFAGAYAFDLDYGLFRCADRRVVQGMKMWTFGYGPSAKGYERGYTDNAGPYIELQSGRHVWDGNYEWVAPHKTEQWSEWWVPVAGTGGATAVTRYAALNVEGSQVAITATSRFRQATVLIESVDAPAHELKVDLDPARPFKTKLTAGSINRVRILDSSGLVLLEYRRPESSKRRGEYTPITRGLEDPPKPQAEMSVEELTLAAEKRLKQLNPTAAQELLNAALKRDPGYSRAHLLLGIEHYTAGRFAEAARHLEQALVRDPYSGETCYYLAMTRLALGETSAAERLLYFVWPDSAFYGPREYQLGRLALVAKNPGAARDHLQRAIAANAEDISARLLLALIEREAGHGSAASAQLDAVTRIDPANPIAQAERFLLKATDGARGELIRLLGGQTQEALSASEFYRDVARWRDAALILKLAAAAGRDPWGTAPEFYYVLAECQTRSGEASAAADSRQKARAAAANVDRFPYRRSSLTALEGAVNADPRDAVARHALACLLYSIGRNADAIHQWEAAVEAAPANFSVRRALGLAYAEQNAGFEKAAVQLERAIALAPAHTATFNDLSRLYATASRFEDQIALIRKALTTKPGDDLLTESLLFALLNAGRYADADRVTAEHTFAPRHRTYSLRDAWRLMHSAAAATAFHKDNAAGALAEVEKALRPPVSLGLDDFQDSVSPRLEYMRGRALQALGKAADARAAYERAASLSSTFTGDRDSWSGENYFVVPALRQLGRDAEAAALERRFEQFALGEVDAPNPRHRAEACYLLGLVRKHQGRNTEARQLMERALAARPDLLAARMELRRESFDPLPD